MNRKAQGLSLNTIVIAAIVIIVLIVVVMIFTGYAGTIIPNIGLATEKECTGVIRTEAQGCEENYRQVYGKFKEGTASGEVPAGSICCQAIASGSGGSQTQCERSGFDCVPDGTCTSGAKPFSCTGLQDCCDLSNE